MLGVPGVVLVLVIRWNGHDSLASPHWRPKPVATRQKSLLKIDRCRHIIDRIEFATEDDAGSWIKNDSAMWLPQRRVATK